MLYIILSDVFTYFIMHAMVINWAITNTTCFIGHLARLVKNTKVFDLYIRNNDIEINHKKIKQCLKL